MVLFMFESFVTIYNVDKKLNFISEFSGEAGQVQLLLDLLHILRGRDCYFFY